MYPKEVVNIDAVWKILRSSYPHYSARHIKWAGMYIYVKLAPYWNNFGPEKDPFGVLLLWLVLGGVPLPTDDVLQPPGHELHQVSQGLSWVNFELGGVPLNTCQKKVF